MSIFLRIVNFNLNCEMDVLYLTLDGDFSVFSMRDFVLSLDLLAKFSRLFQNHFSYFPVLIFVPVADAFCFLPSAFCLLSIRY